MQVVYTPEELKEKLRFNSQTQHIENLLLDSKPGSRTLDVLNEVKAWMVDAFPQLFETQLINNTTTTTRSFANRLISNQRTSSLTDEITGRGAQISDQDLTVLAQSIKVVTFGAGQLIFEQGMAGHKMYGILSGEVEIFVYDFDIHMRLPSVEALQLQQHKRSFGKLVAKLCHGDILGELALSSKLGERSATAITSKPTVMFEITKQTYFLCFSKLRERVRDRHRLLTFLSKLHFFSDWKEQRLQHLFYPMQEHHPRRGTMLMEQGKLSKGMYIVCEGQVLHRIDVNGKRIELGLAGVGSLHGYATFVTGDLSTFACESVIVSSQRATVLFLPRAEFGQIIDRFAGTHTRVRMRKLLDARQKIIAAKTKNRDRLLTSNIGSFFKTHVRRLGSCGLPNGSLLGSHNVALRVALPEESSVGTRTKLRLSLLPASYQHGAVRRYAYQNSNNSNTNTNNADRDCLLRHTKIESTIDAVESRFILSQFDQSRIFAIEKKTRGGPMPCNKSKFDHSSTFTGGGSIFSETNAKLSALRQAKPPPPRFNQRSMDKQRSKYLVNKRMRWLRAAKKGAKNSRKKRRKVPALDEFDQRIDRAILSKGKLEGTMVMR